MLPLPVRQRGDSLKEDGRCLVEDANLWTPKTESTMEGTTTGASAPGPGSSEGLKMTVRNTFIELDCGTPEAGRMQLHGGAQSCTARLNDSSLSFGQSPVIPEAWPEEDYFRTAPSVARVLDFDAVDMELERPPSLPAHAQLAAPMHLPLPSSTYPGASTFAGLGGSSPAFDDGQHSPLSKADRGRMPTALPLAAPPAYAAPVVINEPISPPPAAPPGTKESFEAGPPVCDMASFSTASPGSAVRPLSSLDGFGGCDQDPRLVIKNTFIDVQDTTVSETDRYAMSCMARFADGGVSFGLTSPPGALVGSAGLSPLTPQAVSMQGDVPGFLASLGSQHHGMLDASGQLVCQPCAWFYKPSGCLNAQACRYCHLCPQGELKTRKKDKIKRLREQDAVAVGPASTKIAW